MVFGQRTRRLYDLLPDCLSMSSSVSTKTFNTWHISFIISISILCEILPRTVTNQQNVVLAYMGCNNLWLERLGSPPSGLWISPWKRQHMSMGVHLTCEYWGTFTVLQQSCLVLFHTQNMTGNKSTLSFNCLQRMLHLASDLCPPYANCYSRNIDQCNIQYTAYIQQTRNNFT